MNFQVGLLSLKCPVCGVENEHYTNKGIRINWIKKVYEHDPNVKSSENYKCSKCGTMFNLQVIMKILKKT